MGALTDLLAKLDERCTRLDQIIEAIADIRRLCPPRKQTPSTQLRFPFPGRAKKPKRKTVQSSTLSPFHVKRCSSKT